MARHRFSLHSASHHMPMTRGEFYVTVLSLASRWLAFGPTHRGSVFQYDESHAAHPGAQPDGPVSGFNLARIGADRRLA